MIVQNCATEQQRAYYVNVVLYRHKCLSIIHKNDPNEARSITFVCVSVCVPTTMHCIHNTLANVTNEKHTTAMRQNTNGKHTQIKMPN